jgi:hypothetical protein
MLGCALLDTVAARSAPLAEGTAPVTLEPVMLLRRLPSPIKNAEVTLPAVTLLTRVLPVTLNDVSIPVLVMLG